MSPVTASPGSGAGADGEAVLFQWDFPAGKVVSEKGLVAGVSFLQEIQVECVIQSRRYRLSNVRS